MKKWITYMGVAAFTVWSISALAFVVTGRKRSETQMPQTQKMTTGIESNDNRIMVLADGKVQSMELNDYLTGVLLCEIPGNFHIEAKKAQCVVARTYALRVAQTGVKHGTGIVCTSSGCCQGYLSEDSYLDSGGTKEAVNTARSVVEETQDMVLTYEGALIDATYFSCSGGKTEDAVSVWGSDIPYLQSVRSPGEEMAEHFTDSVRFSPMEFASLLGLSVNGSPSEWFGEVTYTSGGGVDSIWIGDKQFEGTELRTILGLRSTSFSVTALTDSIIITTRGFGHRVGMSQYGAEAMAQNGSCFEEILKHYYQGVSIEELDVEE